MILKASAVVLGLGFGSIALADQEATIDQLVSGEVRLPNIPDTWIGHAAEPGQAWQWSDPENPGNSVTIHRGDPASAEPSRRAPYVVVRVNGRLVGRDGRPIDE